MRWPPLDLRPSLSASMLMGATVSLLAAAVLIVGIVAAMTSLQPSFIGRNGLAELKDQVAGGIRFDASGGPGAGVPNSAGARFFHALRAHVFYCLVDPHGDVLL